MTVNMNQPITLEDIKAWNAARDAEMAGTATKEQSDLVDRMAPINKVLHAVAIAEQAQADAAVLVEELNTCAKHFDLLAKLASATRIGDKHKRPKWQIVADESNVGAAHIREVLKTHSGAALLEELRLLKAYFTANRAHCSSMDDSSGWEEQLEKAVRDLDEFYAIRNR